MATTTDKYNGWTNRATWCVYLWIGNDEALYNDARQAVWGLSADEGIDNLRALIYDSAPRDVGAPRDVATMWDDLLDESAFCGTDYDLSKAVNKIMRAINWREIRRALLED